MLTEHAHQGWRLPWRVIAGFSLLFTGLGHLATELFAPDTPERTAMLATMHGWRVALPGVERTVQDLFSGFSLMMGLLLVGCGALIATARPTRWSGAVVVALTLVATVMAWRYFFVVPGVLTSIDAGAALLVFLSERAGSARSV